MNPFQHIFSDFYASSHNLETKRLKDQAFLGKKIRIFSLNLVTVSVEFHLFSIYPWNYLTLLTQEIIENFHEITTHLAANLVLRSQDTLFINFYYVYEFTHYGHDQSLCLSKEIGTAGAERGWIFPQGLGNRGSQGTQRFPQWDTVPQGLITMSINNFQ